MLNPTIPALILAPMQGLTDAPMRALQGEIGAFTFAVSEFVRVSGEVPPVKLFHKHVPELLHDGLTETGLPVQVQLLGGHSGRMGEAAFRAYEAGAKAIDINFGCPAATVNRHDGGAALLNHPLRIREIVCAIRAALPKDILVSAKLRLGWDNPDAIILNAEMAAEGGASWITIHGRTRVQGYTPPAYWEPIGSIRRQLEIPVVANGDIWTLEDYRRCHEETGCLHFMLGRGALANPKLSHQIAVTLGIPAHLIDDSLQEGWLRQLERLVFWTAHIEGHITSRMVCRLKQWLKIASAHGGFTGFEQAKYSSTIDELLEIVKEA